MQSPREHHKARIIQKDVFFFLRNNKGAQLSSPTLDSEHAKGNREKKRASHPLLTQRDSALISLSPSLCISSGRLPPRDATTAARALLIYFLLLPPRSLGHLCARALEP